MSEEQQKQIIVSLPDLPEGKEFEEYISSFLQLGGFYIERNIIERDVRDILELDIITTCYDDNILEISLVEVKSGNWGFSDLFKIYGWMNYLQIPKGILITSHEIDYYNFVKEKAQELHIDIVCVDNLENTKESLSSVLAQCNREDVDENDIEYWRLSYWVERKLLENLIQRKKNYPNKKCYKGASDYYHELNSGIFFTENIINKVHKLYSQFENLSHLTAKTAHESKGNDFDEDHLEIPQDIFKAAFYNCEVEYIDIYTCTFLEHRARLAILKSAVDYLIYEKTGDKRRTGKQIWKILGIDIELMKVLPSSFRGALSELKKHKYFHRYPVFWQWFLWVFGGFILLDYKDKEYELLSKKSQIPLDEIENAFKAYDLLFPTNGGWLQNLSPKTNIRAMKLFPVPFKGVGANYRRVLHIDGSDNEIGKLQVTGQWTLSDLIKWNNLAVEVLQ